jgi:O-phospho-L-seryl-tRNASec:L-selenocysteinyl-tRNA synthase
VRAKLVELGAEQVLCVLSTTSCFAPRAPDDVVALAQICRDAGIAHVVNNAYGLQVCVCMCLYVRTYVTHVCVCARTCGKT